MLVVLLITAGTCLGLWAEAAAGTDYAQLDLPSRLPTHRRQKRDWIWNQMHIDEEKNTSLPHYVGKVRLGPQPGDPHQQQVAHDDGANGKESERCHDDCIMMVVRVMGVGEA